MQPREQLWDTAIGRARGELCSEHSTVSPPFTGIMNAHTFTQARAERLRTALIHLCGVRDEERESLYKLWY